MHTIGDCITHNSTIMFLYIQDNEKALNGLLAMTEYFRTQHQVKEAIHCLLATLELKPSPRIEMRSRVQLALLLHHHTTNSTEAINHLEKVVSIYSLTIQKIL